MALQVLDVSLIEENEVALRKTVDKTSQKYISLRDSIADPEVGLLSPISVTEHQRENGQKYYKLVDGLHRLTAYKDLNRTEIESNVTTVAESKRLLAQIQGNSFVPTANSQFAQALKQIMASEAFTLQQMADAVHKPKAEVEKILGILDLPKNVQEALDAGTLKLNNASVLRKVPVEFIDEWLVKAITTPTTQFESDVNEWLKDRRAQARAGAPTGPKEKVFVEKPRLRKSPELIKFVEEYKATGSVRTIAAIVETQGLSAVNDVIAATLKYVLSLDPESVAAEKAKFEAELANDKAEKEKRDAEKAARKQAEAAATIKS